MTAFSDAFRFANAIYIYIEKGERRGGAERVASRGGRGAGYPPPRTCHRSSLLFFSFQVVHVLNVRGIYPHAVHGAGYSPTHPVG